MAVALLLRLIAVPGSEQPETSQANLAVALGTRDTLSSTRSMLLKAFWHTLCKPQTQINTPKYRNLLVGEYMCATCLYFQYSWSRSRA